MKSIGFRCWKDKFSYVILEGKQANPTIVTHNHLKLPATRSLLFSQEH